MQTVVVGARAVPWGSISSQARGIRAGKGRKKHPISCSFSGTTTPTPTGGDHALDTWMVLTLSAAATQSLENTRLGSVLSGPLIAIVVGLAAAGLGLVPATGTSPVYGTISDVLLPLGVALYVLEVNVANVFSRESSSMLLAFLCGACATTVGTIASYAVFSRYLSVDGMNIAAALCASYIGGSVNFASVIAALGTSLPSSVPAAMAADNLMMGMYIAVLMWLSTKAKSDAQTSAAATDGPMTASTMETTKTTTATTTTTSNRQNPSSSDSPCPPMSDPAFVVTSVWCSAALGPDGKHAAAASGDGGGGLFVWETGTGRRVRRLLVSSSSGGGGGSSSASSSGVAAAAPGGALAVAWSPQGSPLACCDRGGGVSLWAPRGG